MKIAGALITPNGITRNS